MAVILLSALIVVICPQVLIDFSGKAFIMIICMTLFHYFLGDNTNDK
jgi:hypothetical protein